SKKWGSAGLQRPAAAPAPTRPRDAPPSARGCARPAASQPPSATDRERHTASQPQRARPQKLTPPEIPPGSSEWRRYGPAMSTPLQQAFRKLTLRRNIAVREWLSYDECSLASPINPLKDAACRSRYPCRSTASLSLPTSTRGPC